MQSILKFLEQADNGVLLGIAGALSVLTFLVLGRLGVLLIGLVAGFVLHDYFGGLVADTDIAPGNADEKVGGIAIFSSRKRRELGRQVAGRCCVRRKPGILRDTSTKVRQSSSCGIQSHMRYNHGQEGL